MNYTERQKEEFLSFMRIAIGNQTEKIAASSDVAWKEVFHLAEQHHVLPMVVNAAYGEYGTEVPWDRLTRYKKRAQQLTYLQMTKTERFLSLYRFLASKGLTPLVMKGLICRDLYPNPDFRFSADEDLLIMPDQAETYREVLLQYGLKTDSSKESVASEQETSYKSEDGVLFLEVHRFAFSPDSVAYGEYNSFFEDAFDRAVTETHAGVGVRTIAPTEHLFYLVCHLLKHFLHGGCGIRQVCDIGLFSQKYMDQIDWPRLTEWFDSISARNFAASLFTIAQESLGIDLTGIPIDLRSSETDPKELLDDVLDSGVYGSSTMSRKHGASITLGEVESAKSKVSFAKTRKVQMLFPPASSLVKRYPYLIKHPWLLPIAWLQRVFGYLKRLDKSNTPGEVLRIGQERTALLKQYGLLSRPNIKQVDTGQYLSALCELVEQGHEVRIPIAGSSMTPFLADGRDQVFVKAPESPICRGDIVLYRRLDGSFILHRVYRVHDDGGIMTYDMIGDAQNKIERGIQRKQILAVATRIQRKGRIMKPGCFFWWFFQHIWIGMIPFRQLFMRAYALFRLNR